MSPASDNHTVLLAEDDDDIREIVTEVLSSRGYQVLQARNGREALAKLRQAEVPPSVVLLDLMMPVLDGCGFLSEQRRDPAIAHVPVVLLTAAGRSSPKLAELEVAAYLFKPIELEHLLGTVGRFAAGDCDEVPSLEPSPAHRAEFLARRRTELPQLRTWLEAGDHAALRLSGHNLKGAGGSFGFMDATDVGARLEQAAVAADPAAEAAALDALQAFLDGAATEG